MRGLCSVRSSPRRQHGGVLGESRQEERIRGSRLERRVVSVFNCAQTQRRPHWIFWTPGRFAVMRGTSSRSNAYYFLSRSEVTNIIGGVMKYFEIIGFIGAALMVATLAMKAMIPLRVVGDRQQYLSDRFRLVGRHHADVDPTWHSSPGECLSALRTDAPGAQDSKCQQQRLIPELPGAVHKLATVEKLTEKLSDLGADRNSVVVAFGGGVSATLQAWWLRSTCEAST